MEEIPECLMKRTVKTHASILQDDVIVHKSSLKSNLDFCYHLSSTYRPNSLYHDPLDQSSTLAISLHSLDSQLASSNWIRYKEVTLCR